MLPQFVPTAAQRIAAIRPATAIPKPICRFSDPAPLDEEAAEAEEAELVLVLLEPVDPLEPVERVEPDDAEDVTVTFVEVIVVVELPVEAEADVAPLDVAEQPATVGRVVMPLVAHS